MKTAVDLLKGLAPKTMRAARKIIAHIKNVSYEELVFAPATIEMTTNDMHRFTELMARYEKHEPISKIIGKRAFWKHDFLVNKNVLDPRPETELIVEVVMDRISTEKRVHFLDMGTGSGCILLSLLSEFPQAEGVGIDISADAIEVAKANQQALGIDRATFLNINWNDILKRDNNGATAHPVVAEISDIDVIVSNPPYIRSGDIAELDENVRKYDPLIALDGGEDGLSKYREICAIARTILQQSAQNNKSSTPPTRTPDGHTCTPKCIFLEVGYDQAHDVSRILQENGFNHISCAQDLSGIDRVISAEII